MKTGPRIPQDIIDPAQLKRIESVHRGFFYQHLFAVGCLFRLAGQEAGTIHVERDEDIEIDTGNKTIYVQVKNRTAPLRRTDIESTLARFNTIRSRRQRKEFQFLIASSSELSHQLAREIGSSKWPHEVIVQTPATCNSFPDDAPPSWPTVRDALALVHHRCVGLTVFISPSRHAGLEARRPNSVCRDGRR